MNRMIGEFENETFIVLKYQFSIMLFNFVQISLALSK